MLAAADVHVAAGWADSARERDEAVLLAVALAVRAPRLGHVHVDLATIRDTAAVDTEEPVDLSALPWPDVDEWVQRVADEPSSSPSATRTTARRAAAATRRPWLYLDRYWAEEVRSPTTLLAMSGATAPASSSRCARATGSRGCSAARPAAARPRPRPAAVLRRLAVVAGGPGTGKTTTVARIVALLLRAGRAGGTACR